MSYLDLLAIYLECAPVCETFYPTATFATLAAPRAANEAKTMATIAIVHPINTQASGTSFAPINQRGPDDSAHFVATYNRALRFAAEGADVTIHLGERTAPRYGADANGNQVEYEAGGWLEHTIVVKYASGGGITIGAIQRRPGESSEFHS